MCYVPRTPPPVHYAQHIQPVCSSARADVFQTPWVMGQGHTRVLQASSPLAIPQPVWTRCVASEPAVQQSLHGAAEAMAGAMSIDAAERAQFTRFYMDSIIGSLREVGYFDALAAQASRIFGQTALQGLSSLTDPRLRDLLFVTVPNLAGVRIADQLRADWPVPKAPNERVQALRTVAPFLLWGPMMLTVGAQADETLLHSVAAGLSDDDVRVLRNFALTPTGQAYLAGLPRFVAWSHNFVRHLEGRTTL